MGRLQPMPELVAILHDRIDRLLFGATVPPNNGVMGAKWAVSKYRFCFPLSPTVVAR
jgi:hypothetical protein